MSTENSLKNTLIGAGCLAFGELCFATANALVKYSCLKESQLLCGRFSIQLSIAILWWKFNKPLTVTNWYGDTPHIKNIWLRGATYSIVVI